MKTLTPSRAGRGPEWADAEDRRLRPHPPGRLSAAPGAPPRLDDEAGPAAVLPGGRLSLRPGHQRPRRPLPSDGPPRRLRAGPGAGRVPPLEEVDPPQAAFELAR